MLQHERLANHNPYFEGIAIMTTPHSIAEFTDPEVSPANNRLGTVSYASRYPDYTHVPAIIMKGQWLAAAGFTTGTPFDVRVMPGCIVLTAKLPEPEEPALLQSLRRVCKLSARKQQQVQEFIDVISAKTRRQG
ncbi:putative toxin-antitoxin system toxin component [Citrobacter freundii ATCC 8090 = MTCC 1658 = NBRC 12681]|nr:putative toxin-antitoxin system toxin component [Citrobacter freundii ATCC 8090 = MTCC 1658 = NBRC 12681]